jgi:hypothetical protein
MAGSVPNAKWQPGTGAQVILKEDMVAFEDAMLTQGTVRMQPYLVWVDAGTVRVEATADSPAAMQFTGIPNIISPVVQVSGGLSDGKTRTVTANVSCVLASGGLYGSEKSSQWYVVYALAGDSDTDFTLKAMPVMRVKSQAVQVISTGLLATPATGIGYGFTTDELIDGMVYFLTGASRGLMRTILANNNNNTNAGTIEYSGAALTVAAGDWFVVFPPSTNFRMVGTFFNDSGGDIRPFERFGHRVQWFGSFAATCGSNANVEDTSICCPFATSAGVSVQSGAGMFGPIGITGTGYVGSTKIPIASSGEFNLKFCKYWVNASDAFANYYGYPPGCGY